MFDDIEIQIKVELGSTVMPVHHILRLGRGAVIELDTNEHEPLKIYANDQHIANGEIKINEGQLTVELLSKVNNNTP